MVYLVKSRSVTLLCCRWFVEKVLVLVCWSGTSYLSFWSGSLSRCVVSVMGFFFYSSLLHHFLMSCSSWMLSSQTFCCSHNSLQSGLWAGWGWDEAQNYGWGYWVKVARQRMRQVKYETRKDKGTQKSRHKWLGCKSHSGNEPLVKTEPKRRAINVSSRILNECFFIILSILVIKCFCFGLVCNVNW